MNEGLHKAFLASQEDGRRHAACEAAAKLAIERLRNNDQQPALQVDMDDEAWRRHEKALGYLIMNLMGLLRAPK